ncbi:hypothetical protein LCGC14_2349360, partial [marine sediment metagenome]
VWDILQHGKIHGFGVEEVDNLALSYEHRAFEKELDKGI